MMMTATEIANTAAIFKCIAFGLNINYPCRAITILRWQGPGQHADLLRKPRIQ